MVEIKLWSNPETSLVYKAIQRDRRSRKFWHNVAVWTVVHLSGDEQIKDLETRLRETFNEDVPEIMEGIWLKMILHVLDRVNWREIAKHMIRKGGG